MRILAVIETDLIEKGPHQTHHILERLSTRGHEVRIMDYEINWRRRRQSSLVSKNIIIRNFSKATKSSKVTLIRPRILYLPLLDYLSEAFSHWKEILKQIKSFKPHVVIGFSILNTYIAMRVAKMCNIPFVYYLIDAQHTQIPEKYLRLLGESIESKIIRGADRIIVINDELRRYVVNLGGSIKKTHVIRAGVDSERFNPQVDGRKIKEKYGIGEDEIVLFFMGWLYTFSGLKEVAQSLVEYNGEYKIRFMILGKGDLYDDLIDLKKCLGDRLILMDWQPYSEIPQYVAASDICLLPAYNNEVMRHIVPIKMYEYMACGKPVIATRLPGVLKEFKEGNGVVYVERPEEVLKQAVRLARDRRLMKELGLKAAKYVEKYSWEEITTQFEKLLEHLARAM